jgi:hypothetical protein
MSGWRDNLVMRIQPIRKEIKMTTPKKQEGIDEVLLAVSEFVANGGTLTAENFDEFAKSFEPKPNPYLEYSLDTLREVSRIYTSSMDLGKTIVVDEVEYTYAEALAFVDDAIAHRQETDFCPHGWFVHQEGLCGYCESGD